MECEDGWVSTAAAWREAPPAPRRGCAAMLTCVGTAVEPPSDLAREARMTPLTIDPMVDSVNWTGFEGAVEAAEGVALLEGSLFFLYFCRAGIL